MGRTPLAPAPKQQFSAESVADVPKRPSKKRKRVQASNGAVVQKPKRTTRKPEPDSASVRPSSRQAPSALDQVNEAGERLRTDGVKAANVLPRVIQHVRPGGAASVRAMHVARRAIPIVEECARLDAELSKWLNDRRQEFSGALAGIITSEVSSDEEVENAVAVAAVAGNGPWRAVVRAALGAREESKASVIIGECFLERFKDLRSIALDIIADQGGSVQKRIEMLRHCAKEPTDGLVFKSAKDIAIKDLYEKFRKAWVAVLEDPGITSPQLCDALARLPEDVLAFLPDPLCLADFLKGCYNNGKDTQVAIAALDGLFILISKHGLDYPLFYQKLYAMLTPNILFHGTNKDRFLEMASKFLRFGEFLPGTLVAAFVKRLVRRTLVAPPAGAMWCLRLALELLLKHPNISFLVHRSISLFDKPAETELVRKTDGNSEENIILSLKRSDPFDDDELDPQASNVEQSSLWELEALRNHISPPVSRLVAAFSKDVRKRPLPPPGDLSDYTGLTFEDVFEAEFKRRAKSTPVAYDPPGAAPGVKEVLEDVGSSLCWG